MTIPPTPPPGAPPPPPPPPPTYQYPPAAEGKPVSFYVAIFLGLLLLVSGGLNVLLLIVTAVGSAGGLTGGTLEDDGYYYELVTVGGDRDAETAVLRIPIEGTILETGSPFLGSRGGIVSQVRRALRALRRTPSIRGVLLEIDSPGGGVTDSDEIHRLIREVGELRRNGKKIPVLALLGDMAASGGYYVAVAADKIVARPTTITGSIGVILSSYELSEAMAKIGVKQVVIKSKETPYKDMLSPTRPLTPVERSKLEAIVQELYERFVDVVDEGRPELDRAAVRRLATGEIYSARQALKAGLVDAIGSEREALQMLAEMVGMRSVKVVEHRRRPGLMDLLFGVRTPRLDPRAALAHVFGHPSGPRLLYFWPGGR